MTRSRRPSRTPRSARPLDGQWPPRAGHHAREGPHTTRRGGPRPGAACPPGTCPEVRSLFGLFRSICPLAHRVGVGQNLMFAPSACLDGHGYGPDSRLSVARVDNSIRPVHESLDHGSVEWFDGVAEGLRATAATWRNLRSVTALMLDPTVARSLIQITSDHGEWVELVSDWCDSTASRPSSGPATATRATRTCSAPACRSGLAWRSTRRWHGLSHRTAPLT